MVVRITLTTPPHATPTPYDASPRDLGVDNSDEEGVAATPTDVGEARKDSPGVEEGAGDDVEALYNLQHYDSEDGK